jgi:hypothetical protein
VVQPIATQETTRAMQGVPLASRQILAESTLPSSVEHGFSPDDRFNISMQILRTAKQPQPTLLPDPLDGRRPRSVAWGARRHLTLLAVSFKIFR